MRDDDILYEGRRNKIDWKQISDIFNRLNQWNKTIDWMKGLGSVRYVTPKLLAWASSQVVVPSTDIRKAQNGSHLEGMEGIISGLDLL